MKKNTNMDLNHEVGMGSSYKRKTTRNNRR